ncbi:MAG: Uma2 family endonuclease [Acidobacteriota bacterium]
MAQTISAPTIDEELIAEVEAYMETLVTEDDTPVDNWFSERQRQLLVDPLDNWHPVDETGAPRKFLAGSDVGVFWMLRQPPLVPDMFLSLDTQLEVEKPSDWWRKKNRSYFVWEHGKAPDAAIEIVSNSKGNETGTKWRDYALMGVTYYVVFDPGLHLKDEVLRVFKLEGRRYVNFYDTQFPDLGLGLTLWEGIYKDSPVTTWLRWCDENGEVFPTGAELAAKAQAELVREAEKAELLAAKLRELGVDPDQIMRP